MSVTTVAASVWADLARTTGEFPELFDPDSLRGLPDPAARWLGRVLPDGTPLFEAIVVSMSGSIKLGSRWMPFRADQVLRAGVGFVWRPVVGGRLLRFVGADVLGPDRSLMEFRLHGLIPVAKASGADIERSAAGRLAAETVAWLPQATTPQAGAAWEEVDDERARVVLNVDGESVGVDITVAPDGRLVAIDLDRWNAEARPPGLERFGADVSDEFRTEACVRLAGRTQVGWGHGTRQWPAGEFFRSSIDRAEPITPR